MKSIKYKAVVCSTEQQSQHSYVKPSSIHNQSGMAPFEFLFEEIVSVSIL